jgi:RNA polymerase sigma-70 factor, ECF subfamily
MTGVDALSDPGALALELFERHRGALRSYLRLATGRSDIAEDLAQDVYLRVVRGEATYQSRGKERAWLFSIARHLVVDHFRRQTTTTLPLAESPRLRCRW